MVWGGVQLLWSGVGAVVLHSDPSFLKNNFYFPIAQIAYRFRSSKILAVFGFMYLFELGISRCSG